MQFVYPAALLPEPDGGGFVVTFRDWPEALTQGDTEAEALQEATDCLEEAMAGRIDDQRPIPSPSPGLPGEWAVAVPLVTAMKAALYLALRETGISLPELAQRLGVPEKEAKRLINPRHATKAETLERALSRLGRWLAVEVREAA
jgi:antitoxin HicB